MTRCGRPPRRCRRSRWPPWRGKSDVRRGRRWTGCGTRRAGAATGRAAARGRRGHRGPEPPERMPGRRGRAERPRRAAGRPASGRRGILAAGSRVLTSSAGGRSPRSALGTESSTCVWSRGRTQGAVVTRQGSGGVQRSPAWAASVGACAFFCTPDVRRRSLRGARPTSRPTSASTAETPRRIPMKSPDPGQRPSYPPGAGAAGSALGWMALRRTPALDALGQRRPAGCGSSSWRSLGIRALRDLPARLPRGAPGRPLADPGAVTPALGRRARLEAARSRRVGLAAVVGREHLDRLRVGPGETPEQVGSGRSPR